MFGQYRYSGTHRAPVTPTATPPTGRMLAALAVGGALAAVVLVVVEALTWPVAPAPSAVATPTAVSASSAPAYPVAPPAAGNPAAADVAGAVAGMGDAGPVGPAVATPPDPVCTAGVAGVDTGVQGPTVDPVHTPSPGAGPVPLADIAPPAATPTPLGRRRVVPTTTPTRSGS